MKLTAKPKLNKILKERNLTQTIVAEISGVPQTTVSRFDRASLHTMSHVFAIAKALDLKAEDLFEITEDEQ
jgi:transcriptional regulator with XRE-family HTH domain